MKLIKLIQTKYLGPTNFKGSRVKAVDDKGNSAISEYRSELSSEENHRHAAKVLLDKIETKHKLNEREHSEMVLTACGSWQSGYMFSAERKQFAKGG